MSVPQLNPVYDLVFAGGGTAACVIAGRLAAAAPDLRILVLEAGPPTKDLLSHLQPARYLHHLHPSANTVRFHASSPSDSLGGRSLVVPCGQCLGGGSSVNFTMYTRPSASDYDDWEIMYKNPGWGSKDLIPLIEKTETYQVKPDALNHGSDGPLKVSNGGIFTNVGQHFLDIAPRVDTARKRGEDVNDLVSVNIYGTGRRSDVPHHFIYNQEERTPNLHIVTGVHVKRVLFSGTKATGLEYSWNPKFHPEAGNSSYSVQADKLVVLSAGTFGSPGILERSGVGKASLLKSLGIETLVELDGVGESYQDHNVIFPPYLASPESETLDDVSRNNLDAVSGKFDVGVMMNVPLSDQWFKNGKGLMAHNGIDGGVKMRPANAEELAEFGPEFKERWNSYFERAPDKPVLWMGLVGVLVGDPSVVPDRKYFSTGYFNEYPAARGHVHITSSNDVGAPVDFRSGFLDDMADVKPMMWGYKMTREIARRMPQFEGEYAPMHPTFAAGSQAGHIKGPPVPIDAPKIVYSKEDDKAIERYTREFVSTAWHSLGTCAMKPREEGGVVDPKLNVYGLQGLKVADMSIAPGNVGANTYSTALTIGEKAALIIAEELGIAGV
ncbi:alcohol oxidase-like protein [Dentipellis sp. KUC8613]|nr:alcohol oxidase-like protein [Dentipellis sp. KUC8613]